MTTRGHPRSGRLKQSHPREARARSPRLRSRLRGRRHGTRGRSLRAVMRRAVGRSSVVGVATAAVLPIAADRGLGAGQPSILKEVAPDALHRRGFAGHPHSGARGEVRARPAHGDQRPISRLNARAARSNAAHPVAETSTGTRWSRRRRSGAAGPSTPRAQGQTGDGTTAHSPRSGARRAATTSALGARSAEPVDYRTP